MQIPQNVNLSAKGKGYYEAVSKLIEGQRMVHEAELELATLDGKKINSKKEKIFQNAGGKIVTDGVRDLAKPKITPDYLKAFLRESGKPMSSRDLADKAGCINETVRRVLAAANDPEVRRVGSGNKTLWTLAPATSRINKKPKVANKTTRRSKKTVKPRKSKGSAADRQLNAEAADPAQQKADEDKIMSIIKEKPGQSIGKLMKALKRSYYPVARAINSLVKADKLRPIMIEVDNGRKVPSWEPV